MSSVELVSPPQNIKKVVYFGTPEAAVKPLEALHEAGFEIPLVITKPDRKKGRGKKLTPSPVKEKALSLGLPVSYTADDAVGIDADLGVVVAYGQILRANLLAALPLLNIHFSLLPRWRGAAPVERAILAGDKKTGVCLMVVDHALDTGAVYQKRSVEISSHISAHELRSSLVSLSCGMLVDSLRDGLQNPTPQEGEVTYAKKIQKSELRLDFSDPAVHLQRCTRVGKAWCLFREKRLIITEAEVLPGVGEQGVFLEDMVGTSTDLLRIISVIPEGKREMSFESWQRGFQVVSGEKLG